MGPRRKARECALQILFQLEFNAGDPKDLIRVYWDYQKASLPVRTYGTWIVETFLGHRPAIDAAIQAASKNWRLARMAVVDRNILRIAVAELLYEPTLVPAIVMDEAIEIAKRYGEQEFKPGEPLRGSGDVYAHFRERLASERREHFYAVLLDNKNRKIKDVPVSQGSLTASIVHPRDVFAPVVREAAAAVVFVHNHPSGDPTPSKEDIEITRRLREVGELMGVRVLDHVIIGKGRYVSFVDDGYWS
jgi:DNA repair protein RadC